MDNSVNLPQICIFLLILHLIAMTRTAVGFGEKDSSKFNVPLGTLIPSQVIFSTRKNILPKHNQRKSRDIFTVKAELNSADITFYNLPNDNLLPSNIVDLVVKDGDARETVPSTTQRKTRKPSVIRRQGNLPDLEWRAIPMEHLRSHPYFQSLPLPHEITDLQTMEDVRYFRQGTWQWDALHQGRCTTSQLSAALGFLESKAGMALGIPRSLQHGAMGAYYRLGEDPLQTLEELKNVLCKDIPSTMDNRVQEQHESPSHRIWKKIPNRNRSPFAAKYHPQISQIQLQAKRRMARRNSISSHGVRMVWGSTQEATAILTAINYVSQIDPGVVVQEIGMCGAGLEMNKTSPLLVGASPDAVIQYSNGSLEVLEVKNHCPFVLSTPRRDDTNHTTSSLFRIRDLPLEPTVPPAYLPQLMMEILCLGPQCNSAMMVRQTAISGAVILRVYRDDVWIDEMLYWLNKFHHDYVSKKIPPPENFFWDHPRESKRYRAFVEKTKHMAENVELVTYIKNNAIQRITSDSGQMIPLFLD